jgi:hypothetical protein
MVATNKVAPTCPNTAVMIVAARPSWAPVPAVDVHAGLARFVLLSSTKRSRPDGEMTARIIVVVTTIAA